jgi:hypothetical protein
VSDLVNKLMFQIRTARLPEPRREHRFAKYFTPPRQWRFDLCWPEFMLAVEVEGGIFIQGRHGRGAGMMADMEKYNAATLGGWKVLRVAGHHITKGEALRWIETGLRQREGVKL